MCACVSRWAYARSWDPSIPQGWLPARGLTAVSLDFSTKDPSILLQVLSLRYKTEVGSSLDKDLGSRLCSRPGEDRRGRTGQALPACWCLGQPYSWAVMAVALVPRPWALVPGAQQGCARGWALARQQLLLPTLASGAVLWWLGQNVTPQPHGSMLPW